MSFSSNLLRSLKSVKRNSLHPHKHEKTLQTIPASLSPMVNLNDSGLGCLPVELVEEIFIFSAFTDRPHGTGHPPKFNYSALRIAAVSRTWRCIALSLHKLWAIISIYDPSPRAIEFVKLYLSRAAQAPLSLSLIQYRQGPFYGGVRGFKEGKEEDQYTETIIKLWCEHVQRWESIHLELQRDGLPSSLISLPPGRLGNLRYVGFTTKCQSLTGFSRFWNVIHAAPGLRSISWNYQQWPSYPPPASLDRLTQITLSSIIVDDLWGILCCPQLEHLTVLKLQEGGRVDQPTYAPRLKTLHIHNPGFFDLCRALPSVLNHLSAPSLQDLVLYNTPEGLSSDILKNFLARSKCTLRTLLLHAFMHSESSEILTIAEISGCLDGLEKLICQCSFPWSHLRPLEDRETGSLRVPFPSLLTLEATGGYGDGVVGNILRDREKAGAEIWTLYFQAPYSSRDIIRVNHPMDSNIFEELERGGLRLILR